MYSIPYVERRFVGMDDEIDAALAHRERLFAIEEDERLEAERREREGPKCAGCGDIAAPIFSAQRCEPCFNIWHNAITGGPVAPRSPAPVSVAPGVVPVPPAVIPGAQFTSRGIDPSVGRSAPLHPTEADRLAASGRLRPGAKRDGGLSGLIGKVPTFRPRAPKPSEPPAEARQFTKDEKRTRELLGDTAGRANPPAQSPNLKPVLPPPPKPPKPTVCKRGHDLTAEGAVYTNPSDGRSRCAKCRNWRRHEGPVI